MNTKSCSKCKEVKDFADFDKDLNKTLGVSSACSACRRKQSKASYDEKTKNAAYRSLLAARIKRRNNIAKERAIAYKGGECLACGGIFPSCVYDFHHVDASQKEGTLRDILRKGFEAAKPELDKCVLLCSNCHRLHHFGDLSASFN